MRRVVILFILILSLPFIIKGEEPKIRVFSTGYQGLIPVVNIILKDLGGYKTCYSDNYAGRWKEKGDSLFLNYDYKIDKNKISTVDTIILWKTYQNFIFRDDSIHDCTEYENDTIIFENDTIWLGHE